MAIISIILITLYSFKIETTSSIKVALILDTSNSMDGLINQAKSQLWSVVNELSTAKCNGKTPDLQIALYEYGNDGLPMREGYIRQVTPFTNDLDLISEKLFALRTNGGSEFCGQVIETALNELDWEDYPNDLKLIFIAGNEPFDQGNVSYRDVCKTTREKDITVNTIFCGNFDEGVQTFWKDGAYISGGDYMNIDQDCNYVYVKSPYDDKIMELNQSLNSTYVAYGKAASYYAERQAVQDENALSMSTGAAIQRASSKSKAVYKNVQWDLVDASKEEHFDIKSIDPEELPDEMKGMSEKEMKEYIASKTKEREKITAEINDLTQKREQYVAEQNTNNDDHMLDQAIIKAVRKLATTKNFQFKEQN